MDDQTKAPGLFIPVTSKFGSTRAGCYAGHEKRATIKDKLSSKPDSYHTAISECTATDTSSRSFDRLIDYVLGEEEDNQWH
jgi:hypothetical protein